jgi:hypothetical protein
MVFCVSAGSVREEHLFVKWEAGEQFYPTADEKWSILREIVGRSSTRQNIRGGEETEPITPSAFIKYVELL